jgi:hypothetical protein
VNLFIAGSTHLDDDDKNDVTTKNFWCWWLALTKSVIFSKSFEDCSQSKQIFVCDFYDPFIAKLIMDYAEIVMRGKTISLCHYLKFAISSVRIQRTRVVTRHIGALIPDHHHRRPWLDSNYGFCSIFVGVVRTNRFLKNFDWVHITLIRLRKNCQSRLI